MALGQCLSVIFLLALMNRVNADTPANCTYEDIRGTWLFYETERSQDSAVNCSTMGPTVYTVHVELLFPNIAVDEQGNKGFWTLIYNQGFEVVINYRKYFAFSAYQSTSGNVTSFCDRTFPGWSHDILGHNWACYAAKKAGSQQPKVHYVKPENGENEVYTQDRQLINSINSAQNSWTAKYYPEFEGLSVAHILKLHGGKKSRTVSLPRPAYASPEVRALAASFPESWDWRNVNGINYVSPVRNQGGCGSCYAFSSVGMVEARLRVATNNSVKVTLSPQDVVSCSEYSQGCEGGFPYLIAGKYAQDFGMIEESCAPYVGKDTPCSEKKCRRFYTAHYSYVGGFYGGCNEELMRINLVKNGPMSVSFEVYDDFQLYAGGIYHHVGLNDVKFNPFAITNHAVLLVGYGTDKTSGEKFWIVKNSWGEPWGEQGYFRIRRGTNECSIESIAVEVSPIP